MARLEDLDIDEIMKICKKRKKKSFIDKVSASTRKHLLNLKEHYQAGKLDQCSKAALWEYAVKKHKISVSESTFTHWLEA